MGPSDTVELRKQIERAFQEQEETYHLLDGEALNDSVRACYRFRGYFAPDPAPPLAVIHDSTDSFVRFGGEDHLEIVARGGGLSLHAPRERCDHLDTLLERDLDYAVSLQLGYLGPDIRHVGSGLSASVYLHLPALEQSDATDSIAPEGADSYSLERVSGFYRASRRAAAGETEEATLTALADYTRRLLHYEREARDELIRHHGDAVSEAGHRAWGTILHAQRLDASETAELFNVLRFAVVVGGVREITLPAVTELMLMSHDSQVAAMTENDGSTLDVRRARLIKDLYRSRTGTGE
jgi:protein arginine kinase